MYKFFLFLFFLIHAIESTAQYKLLIKQKYGEKIDSISYGDFIQCMLNDESYNDGYVKAINDSTIIFKSPVRKRKLVSYTQIVSIRTIPRSRIFSIPLVGIGIASLGFIGDQTGTMSKNLAIGIASTGLLMVSINGVDRALRYKPKKLLSQYRVGDLIELQVISDPTNK